MVSRNVIHDKGIFPFKTAAKSVSRNVYVPASQVPVVIQMPIPTMNSSATIVNQNQNQESHSTIIPENELQVTTTGSDISATSEFSSGVSATHDSSYTSSAI